MDEIESKFKATLLGGAIGDALGYPIEFSSIENIREIYGPKGLCGFELDPTSGLALISDDTQMSLFTADGLLWAYYRGSYKGVESYAKKGIYPSYMRWYYTQTKQLPEGTDKRILETQSFERHGSLMDEAKLFAKRSPGNTCLSALASGNMGSMDEPLNQSKGCGGVMRVAPIGLFLYKDPLQAFYVACEAAAITHGHPTGFLAAGALAMLVALLVGHHSMEESLTTTMAHLKLYPEGQETVDALQKAESLAHSQLSELNNASIESLGKGWIAEEALSMAWYAARVAENFKHGICLSVNHGGDSDSTGAICGYLMGARWGMEVLEKDWLTALECRELILDMADKLYRF
ncbi:ADP-ribosylglycohydrolase family protein [Clostridia bacterium]|nr:ADP-ribosylglycohydrolase family protein [Clostridia bacterium]